MKRAFFRVRVTQPFWEGKRGGKEEAEAVGGDKAAVSNRCARGVIVWRVESLLLVCGFFSFFFLLYFILPRPLISSLFITLDY